MQPTQPNPFNQSMALVAPFDPFEALGLQRDASARTIKTKYHQLALRYHPNSNQGTDEAKAGLSEYFYHVNLAWQLLSEPDKRRRYTELLDLHDLHEALHTSTADLGAGAGEHQAERDPRGKEGVDAGGESDADDDDLPRIAGLRKRETFDVLSKAPAGGVDGTGKGVDGDSTLPQEIKDRPRISQSPGRIDSGRDSEGNDKNVAAERRRKFDKLRREELQAFHKYRDAMIAKFEAEESAERFKELFERARWRREYFERAPRDTSSRMKFIRLINNASKAFRAQQQPVGRRKGTSVSQGGQILSTGDPFQGEQFLPLPRTKSIRRKGFSSDISADQSSSEEEYSSDRTTSPKRTPRPASPVPNHRRHRSGDSIPTSLRITPRRLPSADHDPISPVVGPGPRVIVRTPTTLDDLVEAGASEGESPPVTSRSSSLETADPNRGRFKLMPQISTSEFFGSDREERSRSLSAERRAPTITGSTSTVAHPNANTATFQIKQIGRHQHKNIPNDHVHEIIREKEWMLHESDGKTNPFRLLDKLSRLDAAAAGKLTVKEDIKNAFKFRLVYNHREVVKQQHHSFIALSYRRKLQVDRGPRHFSLPLEPEMFQAVWDERQSDKEGIWIDQVCIEQDNDLEKNISMSAMDMVYRSARVVVVALDDLELEAHEGEILEHHMEEFNRHEYVYRRRQPPYLEAHGDLYGVIQKIMRSSWFKRAWCRHEMRLAKDHIFLVPCRNPGSWSGRSVIRFTGSCLTHLLGLANEVAFEPSIEAVKPALYAFFRERSKHHHSNLHQHHGNFTTVVAEVFAMEAGGDPKIAEEQRLADARKDQISIILNTMECGLALQRSVRKPEFPLPMHECKYMLLLLALAAGDPGALCSVGHPLRELPYRLSSSWLLDATNVDSGLNTHRTLKSLPKNFRISTHSRHGEHYVQLDLKFLTPAGVIRPHEVPENLQLAQYFVQVCERRQLGRNRKRYLLKDRTMNDLFGSMWDVYVQTLVCLFECGPDWMSEVCQRYGVSRWRHDLTPAYELLIAFKNTHGKWPESAWSSQAAGFIMDFVNFLVIRGMPQRQMTEKEEWRPICVKHPDGLGRVLTFIPPGQIQVAVPAALLDSEYLHLARLFVLEPRGEYHDKLVPHYTEWTLRGKSVMFSDENAVEMMEQDNGRIRGGEKVFGGEPHR